MSGIFIFVLDRGFVLIGDAKVSEKLDLHWEMISCTIRKWGTSNGLAELRDGPASGTMLDPVSFEYVPFRAVLKIMKVSKKGEKEWKKILDSYTP